MSLTIATLHLRAVYQEKLLILQNNKNLVGLLALISFFDTAIPAESNYLSEFTGTGRILADHTSFKPSVLTLKQHIEIGGLSSQCLIRLNPQQRQQLQQLLQ